MKTALLHYWLNNIRGGEKVFFEIASLYPDADIFTHTCDFSLMEQYLAGHKIHETMIARLPGAKKNCRKYLPLMPYALKELDLSAYDLIISSESGPVKGIRKSAGQIHICYCHTPMRYLWDLYEDYYKSASAAGKLCMKLFRDPLRKYDLSSAQSVDLFLANSRFISERIKRIYGRESLVVYPPADTEFFTPAGSRGDFYLLAGQLVPYKKAELAIQACMKLNRRLRVIGTGPEEKHLRSIAGKNIEFFGRTDAEALRESYRKARALLFPGIEDFGIVPVEAQAAGTPVIAFAYGGALESVSENETGIFFEKQSADALADAILEFERKTFDPSRCRTNALRFSRQNFRDAFQKAAGSMLK